MNLSITIPINNGFYSNHELSFDCNKEYAIKLLREQKVEGTQFVAKYFDIPLEMILRLEKIMLSGHKVNGWCITELSSDGKVQALYTKQETITPDYNKILHFNSL